MVTFTPVVPTLHQGIPIVDETLPTELVYTPAIADGDTVPISSTMLTMVFLQNAAAVDSHDITFPANVYTATAGGAGLGLSDVIVTVPALTTMLAGVFLPYRFANPGGYCAITYGDGEADMSVAVVQVPYTSK